MEFKKLALAAAVAVAPMGAMALEPMQDEALSGVTGQDGISIGLATNLTAGLKIHDTDGHTGNSGAILIDGFSITRANATDTIDIAIDADGGSTATPGAYLNIAVNLPSALTINMGGLNVADSGRTAASTIAAGWTTSGTVSAGSTATPVPLVNLGTMTLGATTLNIQLGNEPQNSMIALNTTITNGISIAGFAVNDANSGGALSTDLLITDNGVTNLLTVNTAIDLVNDGGTGPDGIRMSLDNIGGAGGIDIKMANLSVDGGATQIGDVELVGLNLTGDLYINGK
jgi:hypothetical protein